MTERKHPIEHVGVGESDVVDIHELCMILDLRTEVVYEWVAEGIVQPVGERLGEWQFPARELERARRARRLQRDLELNTASLPLVLDLLGEVERLRRRLQVFENRFFE